MTTTPRTDDEQGQAKAVKEDKLAEIQLRADLAKVMATHEGQRVIRYLLCKADVFPIESPAASFNQLGEIDPIATAHREGAKIFGRGLVEDLIRHTPKKYSDMVVTALKEIARDQRETQ